MIAGAALVLSACAGGPQPGLGEADRFRVFTPIFSDNRVYYVAPEHEGVSSLLDPGTPLEGGEDSSLVVQKNEPLSVIVRSIEIPKDPRYRLEQRSGDYAVILDVGAAPDGGSESLVVWYQTGVKPDQSLNFANLLVYYEPRWDQRVAPLFRIRVLEVTQERNIEARRMLARVEQFSRRIGFLVANPAVSPLIGLARTAAELVLANRQNRMLLDYTVQLYSQQAVAASGSGRLGQLRRGSYMVVGRPDLKSGEPVGREFWQNTFEFEPISRRVKGDKFGSVDAPLALFTVATVDTIVPKLVIERSAALTRLLTEEAPTISVEQIEEQAAALNHSIRAFVTMERVRRYGDTGSLGDLVRFLQQSGTKERLNSEDRFFILKTLRDCFGENFAGLEAAEKHAEANFKQGCK